MEVIRGKHNSSSARNIKTLILAFVFFSSSNGYMGWGHIITTDQFWDRKFSYSDSWQLSSRNIAFGCLVHICALLDWWTLYSWICWQLVDSGILIKETETLFSISISIDNGNGLDSFNQCWQKFKVESFMAWATWFGWLHRSNKW
jgi:hypothetical protein